jgi:hypothetical protein
MNIKKGLWCPRHPDAKLVRIAMPEGKVDLRCPECTAERVSKIGLADMTKNRK